MDNQQGTAIITYGRGWQSLAATRSLGQRGIRVITGDEIALTPASFSKYSKADFRYPSPTHEPEKFLDRLEEVILKHKPEDPSTPYVLMPIHKETYLIAEHRERFEPHITIPVSTIEAILKVHNKGTLAAFAQELDLPIPKTILPKNREDLETQLQDLNFPVFIKLRESAAGVGIKRVKTPEELLETFDEFVSHFKLASADYPIVQEGVPGEDYCVTTLFDQGKLIACMTYHNLRQFPAEAGAGVIRETVDVPAMEKTAAEILGPLNWHGVAELDFRWTGNEEEAPQLIEVNPRFWGGLNQAIASGWDYPWLLYCLARDGKVEPPEGGRYDVRTETPLLGLLATLQEISSNDNRLEELKGAFKGAKHEFREGSKRAGLKKVFKGLRNFVDIKGRVSEAKKQFEIHHKNSYDVLSTDDPMAALGALYPLAIFFKHGKINMELLTSEGGPKASEEDPDQDSSQTE